MKIEKRIHPIWEEFETAKKLTKGKIRQHLGKYQYICSSKKGKISIVEFPNYFGDGKDFWEIYCQEGDLFDDVERFDTLEEAKKKVKELLR